MIRNVALLTVLLNIACSVAPRAAPQDLKPEPGFGYVFGALNINAWRWGKTIVLQIRNLASGNVTRMALHEGHAASTPVALRPGRYKFEREVLVVFGGNARRTGVPAEFKEGHSFLFEPFEVKEGHLLYLGRIEAIHRWKDLRNQDPRYVSKERFDIETIDHQMRKDTMRLIFAYPYFNGMPVEQISSGGNP